MQTGRISAQGLSRELQGGSTCGGGGAAAGGSRPGADAKGPVRLVRPLSNELWRCWDMGAEVTGETAYKGVLSVVSRCL